MSCARRGSFARPPFSTPDSSASVARRGGFVLPRGDLHSQPPIKTILPFYGHNTLCPQEEGKKRGGGVVKETINKQTQRAARAVRKLTPLNKSVNLWTRAPRLLGDHYSLFAAECTATTLCWPFTMTAGVILLPRCRNEPPLNASVQRP